MTDILLARLGTFGGFLLSAEECLVNQERARGKNTHVGVLLLYIGGRIARIHPEHVRPKGERLLSEALRLNPGVPTLAEVRAFVSRTERPAGYAGFNGPQCDESECVVSVGPTAFVSGWRYSTLRRLSFVGIRPATYEGIVVVRGGIVRMEMASWTRCLRG